jgi:hypothetical protein
MSAHAIAATSAPGWLTNANLDELRQRGAHVLVPQQYQSNVSPFFSAAYEMVKLDPNPDNKDVWKLPGGAGLGLSKVGLMKLTRAAGIVLHGSRTVERQSGYIKVQAEVRQRNLSGQWEAFVATKSMDRALIYEGIYRQAKAGTKFKPGLKEEQAREKADADTFAIWKFHEERAETGAYLRALRACMNIRGDFSAEQLTKPFIVRAVHFNPDMQDPTVAKMVTDAGLFTLALFGGQGDMRSLETSSGQSAAQLAQTTETVREIQAGGPPPRALPMGPDYEPTDEDLANGPPAPVMPPDPNAVIRTVNADDLPVYDGEEDL